MKISRMLLRIDYKRGDSGFMKDNVGMFCIINGEVEPAIKLENFAGGTDRPIYDVIRIIGGVPLFFEDHLERIRESLRLLGFDDNIQGDKLKSFISSLIDNNNLTNCNVKLVLHHIEGKRNWVLYISRSYYPTEEEYEKGVRVSLIRMERENPNVKMLNGIYSKTVNSLKEQKNTFEVLLVNKDNKITEGSKSNAFFFRDSKVYTAPDSYVLKGIARKYVFKACKQAGFEVVEDFVDVDGLGEIEGLFISGTSINVLPVSMVDERYFNSGSHPGIISIRKQFDKLVEDYLARHREGA